MFIFIYIKIYTFHLTFSLKWIVFFLTLSVSRISVLKSSLPYQWSIRQSASIYFRKVRQVSPIQYNIPKELWKNGPTAWFRPVWINPATYTIEFFFSKEFSDRDLLESSSDPMNPLLSNTQNSVVRWREWIEQLVSTNSTLLYKTKNGGLKWPDHLGPSIHEALRFLLSEIREWSFCGKTVPQRSYRLESGIGENPFEGFLQSISPFGGKALRTRNLEE